MKELINWHQINPNNQTSEILINLYISPLIFPWLVYLCVVFNFFQQIFLRGYEYIFWGSVLDFWSHVLYFLFIESTHPFYSSN